LSAPGRAGFTRRGFARLLSAFGVGLALSPLPVLARGTTDPRKMVLEPFASAPFPYTGKLPGGDDDFLDVTQDGRQGHTSPRGGIYWADTTYNDNRVLLALPKAYDLAAPSAIVVYFHGNNATLERDVIGRQAVIDQLEGSGLNAALVAPQFAVDAADSSAGRFWLPGAFAQFMTEAAQRLAKLHGSSRAKRVFETVPIILVAYSGGYDPAAYVLADGGEKNRVRGVILMDAVFGEEDKFASWIAHSHKSAFFFSAYSDASADGNAQIERLLQSRQIAFGTELPQQFRLGSVDFFQADETVGHNDFVTDAWEDWPLRDLLARIS
jgi:hypothetical protein